MVLKMSSPFRLTVKVPIIKKSVNATVVPDSILLGFAIIQDHEFFLVLAFSVEARYFITLA